MTSRGRLAAFAAVLPLATGVLLVAAPAAQAQVTSPGNGAQFDTPAFFTIQASYDGSTSDHQLSLTDPNGGTQVVATAPGDLNGGTMTSEFDTSCWTSACRIAPNGTWTVTQSGGSSGQSTFVTRIAPKAPAGVRATAISPREMQLTWRLGPEPDLVHWNVYEGSALIKDAVNRSVCEGTTCSTVIRYAAEGSGEHTYTVQAHRSVRPGAPETLASPMSDPASATLAAAPAPSPTSGAGSGGTGGGGSDGGTGGGTDGPTSGGGTGGSGGGSTGGSGGTGGSTGGSGGGAPAPIDNAPPATGDTADQQAIAQRKAFALGFSAFGPKLGIPKLPPLPQAQAPAIAPELADGTYDPALPFEDQVVRERVEVAQGPTEKVRNVVGTALDSERLLRSTAAALVLLLAGAHLRRWLGASHEEQ